MIHVRDQGKLVLFQRSLKQYDINAFEQELQSVILARNAIGY